METKPNIYGYEDYDVKLMDSNTFDGRYETWRDRKWWGRGSNNFLCVDENILADAHLSNGDCPRLVVDIPTNPQILDKAKKLFVHPACRISRDLVRKKYQRCLNVVSADAVVIPESHVELGIYERAAVFVNDNTMQLFLCYFTSNTWQVNYNTQTSAYLECLSSIGSRLGDLHNLCMGIPREAFEARLVFAGPVAAFDNKQMYILDYLTHMIPRDRVVCESSLIRTLGDESNRPTADSMINIYDMMHSEDRAVRELGFKTLAMMDYIHYPVSTKAILASTSWYSDNNYQPNAVRFMLDTLGVKIRRKNSVSYDNFISQEDWDVVKPLLMYIKGFNEEQFSNYCRRLSFAYMSEEGKGCPFLKSVR